MKQFGWEMPADMEKAFKQIWIETDTDGDVYSKTFMESVAFQLGQWAWLMEQQ